MCLIRFVFAFLLCAPTDFQKDEADDELFFCVSRAAIDRRLGRSTPNGYLGASVVANRTNRWAYLQSAADVAGYERAAAYGFYAGEWSVRVCAKSTIGSVVTDLT